MRCRRKLCRYVYVFLNNTPPTHTYTLSLHDALPISKNVPSDFNARDATSTDLTRRIFPRSKSTSQTCAPTVNTPSDRKSTRLNSSHRTISYAVFCLKKKNLDFTCYFDIRYLHIPGVQ